jgi:hypothetical protein
MPRSIRIAWFFAALCLSPFGVCRAEETSGPIPPASESERQFLIRLMAVESAGRLHARNPASSAYGPFQFLNTTFLDVIRRNFPTLSSKQDAEILQLRADPDIAWQAALVFTRENAVYLSDHGAAVSPANLRLAFFAGPAGAVKVLAAQPEEPLSAILSAAALEANPFLAGMTAGGLIARANRDSGPQSDRPDGGFAAAVKAGPTARPKIAVQCNLKLASCRKWLALAERRASLREARLDPKAKRL